MAQQSRAPALPSAWDHDTCRCLPRRWALGLITPQRKLASRAYYPGPVVRFALGDSKRAYWHVLDYTLAARRSADNEIIPQDGFVLMALTGNSQRAPGFRTQFFQVLDGKNGLRWSRTGVNFPNLLGSGALPFVLRRPYPAPELRAILNRVGNLDTVDAQTNAVQIVLYGVKDWPHGTEQGMGQKP